MGLLDMFSDAGWQPDASKGMLGLLSPSDRFMAAMQAISHMGAQMAQPGQSRGQALASGAAGFGQGLQSGMQSALMQQMMGLKLKDAQQQAEWKRTLAGAFGGESSSGAGISSAASGGPSGLWDPNNPNAAPVRAYKDSPDGSALYSAAAKDGFATPPSRASTLNDPKVQGAIMGLYGPTGLAALRAEDKAPTVTDAFDPQGRKTKKYWDSNTKQWVNLGGSEINPEKLQFRPDGTVGYLPGVVESEAKKTGAAAGAAAAASSPYDIAKAWAIPRVLPPGGQIVAGGGPSGNPANVIMTSPNPAPGSQQGKYEQGIGELQSKTVEGWRTGAEAGFSTLQNVERMKQAVDNGLQTGTFAPIRQATVTALADLGVSQESLNKFFSAKDAKAFDAAAKEMVLPVIKTLGANPTNTDRDFIEKTIPQLRDNPEAVKSLLDWMGQKAQGKIDLYSQGYEHSSKGGDPLKFEQDWWKKRATSKGGADIEALLKKYAP